MILEYIWNLQGEHLNDKQTIYVDIDAVVNYSVLQ